MSRDEPVCNGICVWAYELLDGVSGVAYAHPECELHGYAQEGPSDAQKGP